MDEFIPVYDMLDRIAGVSADAGQISSYGEEKFMVLFGEHVGHTIKVVTKKHNCGAYQIDIACSCGTTWANTMHGCWQQNHQRHESGDVTLGELYE